MPTEFLSDQERARSGSGAAPPRKLRAAEVGGRDVMCFNATLPASGLAIGDTIRLGPLRADVRVLGGELFWDRPQGGATVAVGIAREPAKYGGGCTDRFAATFATHGLVTTTEEMLFATNEVEAWPAGSVLAGYVWYTGS